MHKNDRIAKRIAKAHPNRISLIDAAYNSEDPIERRIAKGMLIAERDGGPGSGNFGHKGRPGEKGGSGAGGENSKNTSSSNAKSKQDIGELDHIYPDGTKSYKKMDVELSPEEQKQWMYAMESWVKSEASKQLQEKGYKRGDIDISIDRDKGTAFVKTWKSDPKSPSNLSNQYFNVKLTGTRTTSVKPDGSQRVRTNPDKVKLEFAGSELY